MKAVNPSDGIMLPVIYGQVGPKIIETGAIDLSHLQRGYQENGQILSDQELEILTHGSQKSISVKRQNAAFLVQIFWAIGLTNRNPILEQGSIRADGVILEEISSIHGWKLSQKTAIELFSKGNIVSLSPDQQSRVEEVAMAIYLPCCDNPALFAECSHGMAMLGLLEVMGSQGASIDAMFSVAKQGSAFWFPQQTLEKAIFMVATQLKDYSGVDARTIVSSDYSSGKGFQPLHQWLSNKGMLKDEGNDPIGCVDNK
jgi:hypothetical protein